MMVALRQDPIALVCISEVLARINSSNNHTNGQFICCP